MIPSVMVQSIADPPVEMIDAREMQVLRILCRCATCGKEYVMLLKQRNDCEDCTNKWLYPPDGLKPAERRPQRREERNLKGWRWLKHFLGIDQWAERRNGQQR